jgi:hypothetical protein
MFKYVCILRTNVFNLRYSYQRQTNKLNEKNMEKTIKVNTANYEVYEFISGYYGICEIGSVGGNCVFAGDSAWEDSYNKELIEDIFGQWDGTLHYTGEKYGYKIEL